MVADATVQRRLAAILAADVAGFSALMERDEEGTYSRIGSLRRDVIEPHLSEHQGRLIKTTGDGFLAEFASPIAALRCALAIQSTQLDDPNALQLRIGLNLGDVIIEQDGDVYGEGVNVAARLEGLADPGGILISGKIHSEVEGKVTANFEDRGDQQVKNISRPVRIYAVRARVATISSASTIAAIDNLRLLALPDKPSIAVLPFQNMSGDLEQEYFADGVVEDIITALTRFKSLFVIARNSSFAYKGRSPDIREVGRDLGVKYVLEGSVRRAGNRLRITAQLIDAQTGAHVWADRFEGSPENIFEFQDNVTEKVVAAIAPRVERAEIVRALRRSSSENADAYDCYLKALASFPHSTAQSVDQALDLLNEACALDPNFSSAYALAMAFHANRLALGSVKDLAREKSEVVQLWQTVARTGNDDGRALSWAAWAVALMLRDLSSAKELVDRAIKLNPNLASAWAYSGWINLWLGHPELAVEQLDRADRLDPASDSFPIPLAHAYFFLKRYEEALSQAQHFLRRNPNQHAGLRIGAASAAFAGQSDMAHQLAGRLLEVDPAFRISRLGEYLGPYQRPEFADEYAEGLRLAELPE